MIKKIGIVVHADNKLVGSKFVYSVTEHVNKAKVSSLVPNWNSKLLFF